MWKNILTCQPCFSTILRRRWCAHRSPFQRGRGQSEGRKLASRFRRESQTWHLLQNNAVRDMILSLISIINYHKPFHSAKCMVNFLKRTTNSWWTTKICKKKQKLQKRNTSQFQNSLTTINFKITALSILY